MRRLWDWLREPTHWLLAFPVAAAVVVGMTDHWPRGHVLREYGPNVASTLMGIALTVFVVERILNVNATGEQKRRQTLAANALLRSLDRIVALLIELLRSGDIETTRPTTIDELIAWWLDRAIDIQLTEKLAKRLSAVSLEIDAELLSNLDRNDLGFPIGATEALEAFMDDRLWRLARFMGQGVATLPKMENASLPGFGGPQRWEEFAVRLLVLVDAYEQMAGRSYAIKPNAIVFDAAFRVGPLPGSNPPPS